MTTISTDALSHMYGVTSSQNVGSTQLGTVAKCESPSDDHAPAEPALFLEKWGHFELSIL